MSGKAKVHIVFAVILSVLSTAAIVITAIMGIDLIGIEAQSESAGAGTGLVVGLAMVFTLVFAMISAALSLVAGAVSLPLALRNRGGARMIGAVLSSLDAVYLIASGIVFLLIYLS